MPSLPLGIKLSAAASFPGLSYLVLFCVFHVNTSAADTHLASVTVLGSAVRGNVQPSTPSYIHATERGVQARKNGAYQDALRDFQEAVRLASEAHNVRDEAIATNRIAGCFIRLFQYRQALSMANLARDLGQRVQDDSIIGIADNNRATVYEQLGDFPLAEAAARDAVDHLKLSGNNAFYIAALTNYGDIVALSQRPQLSVSAFEQAISLAEQAKLPAAEATARDRLANALFDTGDLAGAAKHLQRAYQLYMQVGDKSAANQTTGDMAPLALLQGDYRKALQILDKAAVSASMRITAPTPFWEPEIRGLALLGLKRKHEALVQFEKAVRIAQEWRQSSLPSDASSTRTLVRLNELYQDYIAVATELAVSEHNLALSRRALSVLMETRASTLREQMVASLGKEMNLPPRYFQLLSQIQAAQAAVTLGGDGKDIAARRGNLQHLQDQMAELENELGMNGPNPAIVRGSGTALGQVQKHLTKSELLLSFLLGKEKSFVWAVTSDKVAVYELPSERVIDEHAKAFAQAARTGGAGTAGETLSRDLFSAIDPQLQARPEWLISADGALLDSVPFSALPERAGTAELLSARHSLRFTPSELLIAQPGTEVAGTRFVGVADPVYNFADARRPKRRNVAATRALVAITLARLVASEREVRSASSMKGFQDIDILSGTQANDQTLRNALTSAPEVLHFAVHVVSPEGRGDEAALALTIGDDGVPQLLTKEMISTLRVPGTLVVLSGCSSQQGKPLPSAGLLGLSRAWLLAGASAVLVTAWPTPDDSGRFFSTFYGHLQAQSRSGSIARRAAAALQATQIDMQRSPDYVKDASFWAAYSLISKE